MTRDIPWREDAACAQIGGDLFFLELGGSSHDAKRICRECPVRQQCLEEAMHAERGMALKDRAGVFGGLTRSERHKLAKGMSA